MNKTTLMKRMLSIVLALVLVAGMITAPTIMKINAVEKETELAIDFKKVEVDSSWLFTTSNVENIIGKYFKGKIKIDGKEVEVPFEKQDYGLVIWCNLFNASDGSGTIPVSSVEIAKDTVLEQIAPDKTGSWTQLVEDGQKLKITNELKVEGIDGVWNKVTGEQSTTNIGIKFKMVDGENSWYFTLDDVNKLTNKFYHGTVKADDKDVKIVFEKTSDGFVVWNDYFDIITNDGTNPPAKKLVIPADTVLYEINPFTTGWGTPVEGGQTLKVVGELSYEKKNGIWMSSDEVVKEPINSALDFDFVEVDNSWYINCAGVADIDAKYFKGTILVDGKSLTVPLEKTAKGFVIWPDFFSMIDPNGKLPTEKVEVPAGTVFYQIDPDATGWQEPVLNGYQVVTTNALAVKKENVGWTTGKGVEPIVVTLGKGMGIYNKGTENEVYSTMIDGPENIKNVNVVVKGTVNFDGKDREGVIWLPGNGEIFFYTINATKTLKISKNIDFVSNDKKTVIRFDKNYEIDLVKQYYYEQGKKPTEKKALNVEINYDRLVGQSFMFSWKMSGNKQPVDSWFRTEAIIDGKTKTVLMEFTSRDNAFFIYPNCFNDIPVEKDEGYPVKNFKMKKGTKLTPVIIGTWGADVLGQPYILGNDIDVTKNGDIWMSTSYIEKIKEVKPLEVKIVFKQILNSAAVFEVVTPDGKRIDATYGDWTQARGMIQRGVQNEKTKKYSYTSEYAAYSITGDTFYVDGLRLNELEGLQIDKNTVLYPDSVCKSDTPIKILNQVRIVRDKNDEWVVDTKFTTGLSKEDLENISNEGDDQSGDSSSASAVVTDSSDKSGIGAVAENEDNKKNNYLAKNIVFADDKADNTDSKINMGYSAANDGESNTVLWIVIAAVVVVLAAGSGIVVALVRKRRKK